MNNNLEFQNEDPSPDSIEDNHPRTNYGQGYYEEPKQYPKQETLEEFIEREGYPKGITQEIWEDGVRLGAKWQQEQDKNLYSEEDVLEILHNYRNNFELYRNIQILPTMFFEWFKQFKKK